MSTKTLAHGTVSTTLGTLRRLPDGWRFVAVRDKRPYQNSWQKHPLDREAIAQQLKAGQANGVGLLTGTVSGGILAIDFDGPTAHEVLPCGLTLESLPKTVAYTSGKPGRHQRLYQVPAEHWEAIKTHKFKSEAGDLLELRWEGCQSVIAGVHPETGAYRWVDGCAPWEVAIAPCPPEIIAAMTPKVVERKPRPYRPPVVDGSEFAGDDVAAARALLQFVPASYADSYDDWVTVGMALQSVDDCLLDDWIAWSAQSPKFDGDRKLERKWASFKRSGVTIASLYHLAKQGGWKPTRKEKREYQRAIARQHKLLTRDPNRLHTGGWLTKDFIPEPHQHRLVLLNCPMGVGKTEAIAAYLKQLIAAGIPVVLLTHRRTLGESLSKRFGVPWVEECLPGADLRLMGWGGCLDSAHPQSKLRFNAADWHDAIVIVDELELWTDHLLNGKTEIANHRPEVLTEVSKVLGSARQIIAADAMGSNVSLQLLESLTGDRAYIVNSTVKPFEGTPVYRLEDSRKLLALLIQFVQQGKRCAVFVDSQKALRKNGKPATYSAAAIARTLSAICGQDVPVIDSEANRRGELEQLKADYMAFINALPHFVFTGVIEAGLSITQRENDRPFDAMFIFAEHGHISPGAIAQTGGRVRPKEEGPKIPRFIVCPDQSNLMRSGNGSLDATEVASSLNKHQAAVLAQLAQASIKIGEPQSSQAYLKAWAELAARRNREGQAYAASIERLMELNGFVWRDWEGEIDPSHVELCEAIHTEDAEEVTASAATAILEAEDIDDNQAEAIAKSDHATAEDLAALRKHGIKSRWGDCTAQLLAADVDGLYAPLRLFFWFKLGKSAAAARDAEKLKKRDGRAMFAPDLAEQAIAPKVRYLFGLKVNQLLERSDWFAADDPLIQEIVATATAHTAGMAQILGIQIKDKTQPTTIIRNLLKTIGFGLRTKSKRIGGDVQKVWKVAPLESFASLPLEAIFAHWLKKQDSGYDWEVVTKTLIDHKKEHLVTGQQSGTGAEDQSPATRQSVQVLERPTLPPMVEAEPAQSPPVAIATVENFADGADFAPIAEVEVMPAPEPAEVARLTNLAKAIAHLLVEKDFLIGAPIARVAVYLSRRRLPFTWTEADLEAALPTATEKALAAIA